MGIGAEILEGFLEEEDRKNGQNLGMAQISSLPTTSRQGTWELEGSPPTHCGTSLPQGTQEESVLPPPCPALPYRPVRMPGRGWSFTRTPLLILWAPGTKVQSQVVMGFTYLRGGLGPQAMGYAMEHYLQSQKSGTDHSSIDRRPGEGTLAQPPTPQVSAEEGWRVMSKY